MKRGALSLLLALLLTGTALSGCGQKTAPPEYVLTYADNQSEGYPTVKGAQYFADLVEEKTDGRIQILVYPGGELGDEKSVIEQVKLGGIDFMRASDALLLDESDMASEIMMPYLYDSRDSMWKVLDGDIGTEVKDSFAGTGLCALAFYDAGVRNFYTAQPLDGIDDLQGLTIRVLESALMADVVRYVGATPVQISYSDVYDAIRKGEVDGAENNWPSYVSMHHEQVAPYVLEDEHARIPEMIFASEVTMSKLSKEDQDIIRECAEESGVYERKLWKETEDEARQQAIDNGCTVVSVSDEDKEKLRQMVEPLYEKYCGGHEDVIEQIRKIQQQ